MNDQNISTHDTSGPKRTTRVELHVLMRAGGTCVTTSTKDDELCLTAGARRELRTICVFDPDKVSHEPKTERWNIGDECRRQPMNSMHRGNGASLQRFRLSDAAFVFCTQGCAHE